MQIKRMKKSYVQLQSLTADFIKSTASKEVLSHELDLGASC